MIPVYRAGGIEFLDAHPDVQVQIPSHIGDAEASLAQYPAHQVFFRQDSAHRKLVRFVVLPRAPAAAGAHRLIGQSHTAEAPSLFHTDPFSFRIYEITAFFAVKG